MLPTNIRRLRRLRATSAIRDLLQQNHLRAEQLVFPLFVHEKEHSEAIPQLPGHKRLSLTDAITLAKECLELGIKAFAIFPVVPSAKKDERGSYALQPKAMIYNVLSTFRAQLPQAVLIADVALDPYTTHGHDGIWNPQLNDVDNDATVEVLQNMAVLLAKAGAHFVAPSDMMDGRIMAIRTALDQASLQHTGIISYAAKFASCYYGPFRHAIGAGTPDCPQHTASIDKRTYQLNPANCREAVLECLEDAAEGADVLLVKPAGHYLDIIYQVKQRTLLPVAAYQVSAEFAAICSAAEKGWLDKNLAAVETLLSIRRAGADMIFTYFAKDVAKLLHSQ